MKKIVYLVLSLVLVLALTGCGEKKNTNQEVNNQSDAVAQEQEEKEVKKYFAEEDMFTYGVFQIIRLDENPTTGYRWVATIDDDTVAVVEGDEYVSSEADDELVGVGGVHAYRIAGLQQGNTKITFRNMRSWEGEDSIVETVTFDLAVNESSELAITAEVHE